MLGATTQQGDGEKRSAAIKISHLPYGFFEQELLSYFNQFGRVLRVRVARSRKSGNHRGWAFVLFADRGVAEIAVETMDGYLMFEKRLACKVLKNCEVPVCLKKGYRLQRPPVRFGSRRKHTNMTNRDRSEEQVEKARDRLKTRLRRNMGKLRALGVDYSFGRKTTIKQEEEEDMVKVDDSRFSMIVDSSDDEIAMKTPPHAVRRKQSRKAAQ